MPGPRYRIFVSSPSDVFGERERIERVITRLNGELGGGAALEAIRWEQSYYTADKTFQDQIVLPSQTDLVICILWKRLGAELPPAYRRSDGTTPTGTEYEFEDAMQAARTKGTPDVIVYRKTAAVLLDAQHLDLEKAQFDALKHFWSRWFVSDAGHFTAAFESFESTDQFEVMVEAHIRQWLARNQAELVGNVTWPIALKGSPFRGLQPFDEAHAEVFFGRRRAVERLRQALTDAAGRGTPFLLVLGMSGSGKSSVIRAGLLPRITQIGTVPGVDLWRRCAFRPSEGGGDALLGLARALYRADVLPELGAGDNTTPAEFAALLRSAPEAAARAVRAALGRAGSSVAKREGFERQVESRLLLVVDQFEEALGGAAEVREQFGAALAALAAEGQTWIVGTLRSDLYAAFQGSKSLVGLRERGALFDLLPPTGAEIAEIVTGPAAAAGLRFENRPSGGSLDEELIAAAAEPGSLPLLQLALDELFVSRDPQTNTLAAAAYDAFGGLAGVVERRAEEALAGLDPEAAGALPQVIGALVNVAEDGVVTSRPALAAIAGRAPGAGRLIDAFVAARLLVVDEGQGAPVVRVAHEALIGSWPRAAAIIAADRDALRVRGRVEEATRRWVLEGQHSDFLLPPGRPLAEASDLAARRPEQLSSEMMALVQASEQAEAGRQAEAKAQSERQLRLAGEAAEARADAAMRVARRTRAAAVAVSLLLVVAAGAAAFAWVERSEAQRREVLAEGNFGAALNLASQLSTGATLASQSDFSGAVKAYRDGVAIVKQIGDRDPDASAWYALQRTNALLHRAIGRVLVQAGDTDHGNAELLTSLDLFKQAGTKAPPEADAPDDLVSTEQVIASALFLQGDSKSAAQHLRDGVAIAEPAIGSDLGKVDLAVDLVSTRKTLGDVLSQSGDEQGALAAYEAGRGIAERFQAAHPADLQWLEQIAASQQGAGFSLRKLGDPDGSLARFQLALSGFEQLIKQKPDDSDLQHQAIETEQSVALGFEVRGNLPAAIDHATAALTRAQALSAKNPSVSRWQLDVAVSETYVGAALKIAGRPDDAKPHFDKAQSLMSEVTGASH